MRTQASEKREIPVGVSDVRETLASSGDGVVSAVNYGASQSTPTIKSGLRPDEAIQWIEIAIMVSLGVAWIGTAFFAV